MYRILIAVFFFCLSQLATAQISAVGRVCYKAGDIARYPDVTTIVNPTYNNLNGTVILRLSVVLSGTTDASDVFTYATTKVVIDTYTGTGTGDTAKFHNACLQAVKAYLESLTENTGVTFTII